MADRNGTTGPDVLVGTEEADVFTGLAGNDTISGLGGDDTINWVDGAGNDVIGGGAGDDTVVVNTKPLGATAANQVFTFDGDNNNDGTLGAAGTDTLKLNFDVVVADRFGAIKTEANASNTLVIEDGNNDHTFTLKNVEKVVFKNGEFDLTDTFVQTISNATNTATVATAGGAASDTSDVRADGNFINLTPSTGVLAAGLGGTAADWVITAFNGTAVDTNSSTSTKDSVVVKDNYTLKMTSDKDFSYTHDAKGRSNVVDTTDTFTVTLTNKVTGETVTQKYSAKDTAAANAGTDETLVGTDAADAITVADSGGADKDIIDGGKGNDVIVHNDDSGSDTIKGGDGDDKITDVGGANTILGGSGNDTITSGAGADKITGGAGNDQITGVAGDTIIFENAIESGSLTTQTATANGEGTDTFTGATLLQARNLGETIHGVVVNGGVLFTGSNDSTVGATTLTLADLNSDNFKDASHGGGTVTKNQFGGEESVTIRGGETKAISLGDELFELKGGKVSAVSEANLANWKITKLILSSSTSHTVSDTQNVNEEISVDGGAITVTSRSLSDGTQISYSAETRDVETADVKQTILVEVTNGSEVRHIVVDLKLTGESEKFTTTDGADVIDAGEGADTVDGGKGDDVIDGGAGADNLKGGEGDDNLKGGDGDDTIDGGDGNDSGNGGDGNDLYTGGKGNDQFYAGPGDDGDDTLDGQEGDDTLGGGEGDDQIDGGEGSNLLFGGEGDDTLQASTGDDSLEGDSVVWAGDGDDSIVGGSKNDKIGGGEQDDTISGGDGNDTIFGGASGRDNITAGKGDDVVYASAERDTVSGGDGDDTLFGGDASDELKGGKDEDLIYGGAGDDELFGDAGGDTLYGGAGVDELTGGANADTFVFATGDGADAILDFSLADDTLDLTGVDGIDSNTNLQSIASETKRSGKDGVLLDLDNNDSIFIQGIDLGDLSKANIDFSSAT